MSNESLNTLNLHTISHTPEGDLVPELAAALPHPLAAADPWDLPSDHDVAATVNAVLLAAPGMRALRQEVARELGEDAAGPIDQLEPLATALARGQAAQLMQAPRVHRDFETLKRLVTRGLYEVELALDTLVRRKEIRRRDLPRRRASGDLHGCLRLLDLVTFVRDECEGGFLSSRATRRELEQAERAAWDLLSLLGKVAATAAAEGEREVALARLLHAYEAARSAIWALPRKGIDLEGIAPELPERVLH